MYLGPEGSTGKFSRLKRFPVRQCCVKAVADRGKSPGRFFAVAVMKAIVARVLTEYDVRLVEPEKSRWFTWRTFMIPREETLVALTPRAER